MAILHIAVANDEIAAGNVDAAPVGIASGFNRDAVVARVKGAVFDQDVGAGFGIAAIVIGAVRIDAHAADRDIGAEHGIQFPHGGVLHREAFQQHVRAPVGLNEVGSQIVSGAVHALGNRHVPVGRCDQGIAVLILIRAGAAGSALPVPPVGFVGAAIERAGAGDGDVGLPEGVDEGRVIHALGAFPAGIDHGQIMRGIRTEAQRGAARNVQVDVALQVNGPGQEGAGGNDDSPTTSRGAGRDGFPDTFGAIVGPAGLRAVAGDVEILFREGRRLDAAQNRGLFGIRRVRGAQWSGGEGHGLGEEGSAIHAT